MPTLRMLRLISVLVVPVCALATAPSAQASTLAAANAKVPAAQPAASYPMAAYVWSNSSGYYTYNSSGEPITVTDLSTAGEYEVIVDGLGPIGGDAIVAVTAYHTTGTCEVSGWSPSGSNLHAFVDCHDDDGNPAASLFDLVVTRPASPPNGVYDYSFVNDSTGSKTLSADQYNSAHKKNAVKFLSAGKYQVTFGGGKSSGTHGTVQLSMYGSTGGECDLVGWHGARTGEIVDVDCFGSNGVPEDSDFTLIYASASNLLGLNGIATANAFANRSGTASYRPSVQYDSVHAASVTVKHLGPGQYEVVFTGSEGTSANGGDVQVSAIGENGQVCTVDDWDQAKTPAAFLTCAVEADGAAPFDTQFVVNWVVG
jgi:hypothetical protein